MPRQPIITLTTDFGLNDHFVGTVKGVILGIVPEATIVDISHSVQAFDILDGALAIAQSYSYFPSGTVHMVVIDPGVGSARRPIIASSDRHHFVAPDNGVLSLIYAREERMHVREITQDHYFHQPVANTFHARDIFAPVSAYLAKGVDSQKFGEEVEDFTRFNAPRPKATGGNSFRGVVLKVDRFGNLITNFTAQDVPAMFEAQVPPFKIVIGKTEITSLKNSYTEGGPGEIFAILGSMGYLEISTNRGSATQLIGVGKGGEVNLTLAGSAAAANG